MYRTVSVVGGVVKYAQKIEVGPHVLRSDEPTDIGGKDAGPNAQEFVLAGLGACVGITVQMYAERHQWPLQGVHVTLSHSKALADNTTGSGAAISMVDQFEIEVSFTGDLSEDQRNRLFEIANRCPVHRMLVSGVQVHATLLGH
jgi:putative redox protein